MAMPPYNSDAMGCPAMKFKYGKDCLCEDRVACRGLTAAFSMLGNDPRSLFVRLPNYKENPTTQYYIERNQQREAYLRCLLPNHPVEEETNSFVALHHFHPRIVSRLVSKLQKNIPRTLPEKEIKRMKLKIHERDRIYDQEGNPTGRCIFAPNYPMEKSKEDLKRLLRLCRTLNEVKDKNNTADAKASSFKPKKKRKRKFDPDIRSEGDLVVADRTSDDPSERFPSPEVIVEEEVDSLAQHNIQSLLESFIRLEPIPEDFKEESTSNTSTAYDNLKVEPGTTQETEPESVFTEEDEQSLLTQQNNTATVSMQIRLEKLHTGKGKKRISKVMNKAPSPFFEISVLHQQHDPDSSNREVIYRSYPLTDTKNATWDPIESLDLHVEHIDSPQDLNFQITVHDCDMKGGNHLLIGTSEVNALDLITTSSMSVPIKRDLKVKGFLQVSHFQLETLMDDESIFSVVSSRTAMLETASEQVAATAVETVAASIQFEHPESPDFKSRPPRAQDSPVKSDISLPGLTPDGESENMPPATAISAEEEQSSPTSGDGYAAEVSVDHEHEYTEDTVCSTISVMSMPTISMQLSLENLHTGKGKKKGLARKMMTNTAPSPFFDFAVLHKDEQSGQTQWETVYQSYPLLNTKSGTWAVVEDLELGVLVHSTHVLCFRITVYDCDMKSGNHRLIGAAEVNEATLADRASISIQRDGKIKGFLRFDQFKVDWSA